MPAIHEIPELSNDVSPTHLFAVTDPTINANYYRQFARFFQSRLLYTEIGFALTNTGSVPLANVRIDARIEKTDVLRIQESIPEPLSKNTYDFLSRISSSLALNMNVQEFQDHFTIKAREDGIQPKRTEWTDHFYVGALANCRAIFRARVYADELEDPAEFELEISIASDSKSLSPDDIVTLAEDLSRR